MDVCVCCGLWDGHLSSCLSWRKTRARPPRPARQLGVAFKESLVPRAVEWFTGEAAPPMYGDEGEFGEDDFEGEE